MLGRLKDWLASPLARPPTPTVFLSAIAAPVWFWLKVNGSKAEARGPSISVLGHVSRHFLGGSDLFWLNDEQMEWLRPVVPMSHGRPRVDGRWVSGGITFINRNELRRCDAPAGYGPHKTGYNRWSRMGVLSRIMAGLAEDAHDVGTIMIDATYLMVHRSAASLVVKDGA